MPSPALLIVFSGFCSPFEKVKVQLILSLLGKKVIFFYENGKTSRVNQKNRSKESHHLQKN